MDTSRDVMEMLITAIGKINRGNPVAAREYIMTAYQMTEDGALER